jgi:Na+-transporting NADH:ubiquinone oxidoreductase subunit C
LRALLVVLVTAVICSSIVSGSVVLLRPIQLNNELLRDSVNILRLSGQLADVAGVDDAMLLEQFRRLDARVVDIDEARVDARLDPYTFDARSVARNPGLAVQIPPGQDDAGLGQRSRYATVYLVWRDGVLDRVIVPISGVGMWSMIRGYLALESDFNTIAAVTFYEQNETPGLGDQITQPYWQAQWVGKRIYDDSGSLLFRVAEGAGAPGSASAAYQVDALTGATVTANAVSALVRYWMGPHGYGPLMRSWRERPPQKPSSTMVQES